MPQRFENFVAISLHKWVHDQQDAEGRDRELRYFRDIDGREADFVVLDRSHPIMLIEAKWSDAEPDRGLRYLKARFPEAAAGRHRGGAGGNPVSFHVRLPMRSSSTYT